MKERGRKRMSAWLEVAGEGINRSNPIQITKKNNGQESWNVSRPSSHPPHAFGGCGVGERELGVVNAEKGVKEDKVPR